MTVRKNDTRVLTSIRKLCNEFNKDIVMEQFEDYVWDRESYGDEENITNGEVQIILKFDLHGENYGSHEEIVNKLENILIKHRVDDGHN